MTQGVPARLAMELMRHSDIKLTTKTYTDSDQLHTFEAASALPWMGKEGTPKRTPETVANGQKLSLDGESDFREEEIESLENKSLSRDLALSGVVPITEERIAGAGFEPAAVTPQYTLHKELKKFPDPPVTEKVTGLFDSSQSSLDDLRQELLLGQLTSIWSKLELHVQAALVLLAESSLSKFSPPDVHPESENN